MKKFYLCKLCLVVFGALLAVQYSHSSESDFEPKNISVDGNKVIIGLDFSSQLVDCGIEVNWGDGSDQSVRVGRDVDKKGFQLTHVYKEAPTGKRISIDRKMIFKGLGTVPPCVGSNFSGTIGDKSRSSADETQISEVKEAGGLDASNRVEIETRDFDINSVKSSSSLYQKVNRDWSFRLFCDDQKGNFNIKPHVLAFFYKQKLFHKQEVKGGGYCPLNYAPEAVTTKLSKISSEERDLALAPFKKLFKGENSYFQVKLSGLEYNGSALDYLEDLGSFDREYSEYEALVRATGLSGYLNLEISRSLRSERSKTEDDLIEMEFSSVLRAGEDVELATLKKLSKLVVNGEKKLRSQCMGLVSSDNFAFISKNCKSIFHDDQEEFVRKVFDLKKEDSLDLYSALDLLESITSEISAENVLSFNKKFAVAKQILDQPLVTESVHDLKSGESNTVIVRMEPEVTEKINTDLVTSSFRSGTLSLPNPKYSAWISANAQADSTYQQCLNRRALEKAAKGTSFMICTRPYVPVKPSPTISQAQYSSYQYTITNVSVSKKYPFKVFAKDGGSYRVADCLSESSQTFTLIDGMHAADVGGRRSSDTKAQVDRYKSEALDPPISDCLLNVAQSDELFNGFAEAAEVRAKNSALAKRAQPGNGSRLSKVTAVLDDSVVVITTSDGLGTGFYVAEKYLISNAHVVGESPVIKMRNRQGKEFTGVVMAKDEQTDLALIATGENGDSVTFATGVVGQGMDVFALGHPVGLEFSISKGIVSAHRTNTHKLGAYQVIQTDAAISPGNSGGPLVTEDGAVVGVNVYKRIDKNAEGLGFAVNAEDIRSFLKENGVAGLTE